MDNMETLVNAAVGSLPPPNDATNSSPGPTPCSSRPSEPQTGSAESWKKTLTGTLSSRDDMDFRRFFIRLDETTHPKVAAIARWTEAWIKAAATNDAAAKSKWMVLSGSPGCGKTHAIKAAYRFLRDHNGMLWPRYYRSPVNVVCYTWSRIVGLGPLSWNDIEEEVRAAKIVLVDDIGSEVDRYKSGEPAERLRSFLELAAPKWLAMTTNVLRKDFAHTFDARVQSRLERAVCLDLVGVPDYRPKMRGE